MMSLMKQLNALLNRGNKMKISDEYSIEKAFFNNRKMNSIEAIYNKIEDKASRILTSLSKSEISIGSYYKENKSLIVVPEKQNTLSACRIEYLNGYSKSFYEKITRPIKLELETKIGKSLVLFKDKCNLKNPGGGAFPPHQDAPAYIGYGPNYFITVALFLDDATKYNGCLHFATNYKDIKSSVRELIYTPFGEFPILQYYEGGDNNGDIFTDTQRQFEWDEATAKRGDLIIFNSYLPHFSYKNNTVNSRRVIYLTFNLSEEGDYYEEYYTKKWEDYDNPKFHISTPTQHKGNTQ